MNTLKLPRLERPKSVGVAMMSLVVVAALLSGVVSGLGKQFFDDAGSDPTTCDVYDYDGTTPLCTTRAVRVTASNTASVPKGRTTVMVLFHNIPTNAAGRPDGTKGAFTNNNVQFTIQGSYYCPSQDGVSGNINNRDRLIDGYWAPGGGGAATGPTVGNTYTQFLIPNYDGSTRTLNSLGQYRTGNQYCTSGGSNYSTTINVNPVNLIHEPGFPPDVFYLLLVAQPNVHTHAGAFDASAYDANGYFTGNGCSGSAVNQCDGVSNGFRVVEDTGAAASVTQYYYYVSTSSRQTGDSYNVTIKNGNPALDSLAKTANDRHSAYVMRFGADCSVVSANNGQKKASVVLYDVDDSQASGDTIKALLVEHRASDGHVYTLKADGLTTQAKTGPVGTWKDQGTSYNPRASQTGYGDAFQVDNAGTNQYESLNFTAYAGDTYEMYLYDVRSDLVNQYGLPFDGVYNIKACDAEVDPDVTLSAPNGNYVQGATAKASASIQNVKDLDVTAPWTRYFYYSPSADDYGAVGSQSLIQKLPASGTTKTLVAAGTTVSSADGTSFGGPWTTTITQSSGYICTELKLDITNLDPAGTTTKPASGVARSCRLIGSAGATPYFSARGGDVVAGPDFGIGSCAPDSTAKIEAHFNTNSPYGGASSQLAALALDDITGFATNRYQQNGQAGGAWLTTLGAGGESALAFSNTTANSSGQFGGNLGAAGGWCVPDYYAAAPNGTNSNASSFTVPTTSQNYTFDVSTNGGVLTLNGPGAPLPAGVHVTIRVNGDVRIMSPIRLATSGIAGPSDVPSFQLLVKGGNIYVDKSVTQLDGLYAAQPDGSNGGVFVTCAAGSKAEYDTGCNSQLLVNGSVAAKLLVLNRTGGDISGTQTPAETFQYSPQMWLGSTSQGKIGPWDAVTSLPPVL